MKLAINDIQGSFSSNWIKYCKLHQIDYDIVNCRDVDIMERIKNYDGLLWHWGPSEAKYAIALTWAIERLGIKVFPDFNTCWHFDNKVYQKYMIEVSGLKSVPTYIFYDKASALDWLEKSTFPIVFKLRNGASSLNVKLIKTLSQGKKIIRKAFSTGFNPIDRKSVLTNQIWKFNRDKSVHSFLGIINGLRIFFAGHNLSRIVSKEKGYVYFQDFISNNSFDTRVVVIGNRCFALRRYNRTNDFRASGSGLIKYEHELFDKRLFSMAFELSKKFSLQSVACDFIYSGEGLPLLIEFSYGFMAGKVYEECHGYWDEELNWRDEKILPEFFIIEDFIKKIKG